MVVGSPLRSWTGENLTVPRFLKLCFFLKISKFLKIVKICFFFLKITEFLKIVKIDIFFGNYRIFDLPEGFAGRFGGRIGERIGGRIGGRICHEVLPEGFVNFSLFLVRTPTSGVFACPDR